MKYIKRLALCLLCLILVSSGVSVCAEGTSNSYVYDSWDNAMSVSEPYTATAYLMGADVYGGTPLNAPTDIFVLAESTIYVLDAGNNRVVAKPSQRKPGA